MKKYRNEKEWRDLFSEQRRSGLSAKQFCLKNKIQPNMFYRKKKLLGEGGGLVRLPVGVEKGTSIEIAVNGMTIGVRSGFAGQELVRVLKCVREALDA